MDEDLTRWILEFVVQQPIADKLVDAIVSLVKIPHDFRLSKLFLIRKLESEVNNGAFSEKVLDLVEKIYDLDKSLGSQGCSQALKKAFCAVAVESSVLCLKNSANNGLGKYFDVVKRFWRGTLKEMERANVGLVSDELLRWRDDIETSIWEESVCQRVVERSEEVDAVQAVRAYVEEEKSRMGPSFIELVSETLSRAQCRIIGAQELEVDKNGSNRDKGKTVVRNGSKNKCPLPVTFESCRPVKIKIVDDSGAGPSCTDHLMKDPEVEKVQEMTNEDIEPPVNQILQLPGVLNRGKSLEENAESSGVEHAVNVQSGEASAGNAICRGQSNPPKSYMERNKTACTFEWNDSIDRSSMEPSPGSSSLRPQLPSLGSPREGRVLPRSMSNDQNSAPPRKKRWSKDEEDALRAGVQKFGKGSWKEILIAYRDIFEGRSNVDLKDKWRNMDR